MKAYFALIITLVLLSGCVSQQPQSVDQSPRPDLKAECCNQCKDGASGDPRGMDISGQPCNYYKDRIVNGRNILTPECAAYFEETGLRVMECG